MDIFKFSNPNAPTHLDGGQIINGLKRKMWVERYLAGGEFSLVANANLGIRELLPVGSLISHIDTTEVMIVENHEIADDVGKEAEITITGRGFETIFEQRIVGSNNNYPTVTSPIDYTLAADYTWNQAVKMISDHILAANLIDDNNEIPYVSVMSTVSGVSVSQARTIKKGDLYKAVQDLLAVDGLGLKVVRPGLWSPLGSASPNIAIVVHVGVDRSSEVIFSYDTGEITSADYLWSNKKLKNAALVTGKWVETVVLPAATVGYARRWMLVDASDLDNSLNAAPTGAALTSIIASMQQRGAAALAAQNDVALTKAEVSKESTSVVYRQDYDVGDIITVHGDYNESSQMRVSEYVEIEDENGMSGYPTLTMT